MTFTLFGIPNCDTVKKSRKWLDSQGVSYTFHDFRENGVPQNLENWINDLGWESVINKRSTSWRALTDEQKTTMDNGLAAELARETPTLIRRPVLLKAGVAPIFGFKESAFADYVA